MSVLSLVSKIFKKVIYDHLSQISGKMPKQFIIRFFGKLIPHKMLCSNYYMQEW